MYLQGPRLGERTRTIGCTALDNTHLKTRSQVIWPNAKNTPIICANSTNHVPGHQHPASTMKKAFHKRWIRLWIWPDFESIQSSEIRIWTVSSCITNSRWRGEIVLDIIKNQVKYFTSNYILLVICSICSKPTGESCIKMTESFCTFARSENRQYG